MIKRETPEEKVADSITRFLIGDASQALKELAELKATVFNISNNASCAVSYNQFYEKTFKQILKIVRQ